MKLDAFRNDGNAYLRYTLAKELNPKVVLRLFHAGPGTFWTDLKSFQDIGASKVLEQGQQGAQGAAGPRAAH